MNIYGAVILGVLIGIIVGTVFSDQIMEILSWATAALVVIAMFIPFCFYYGLRMAISPVDPAKWEENKHYFKYKELFKGFFICYEANASRPWKLFFFLRLKKT